MAEYWPPTIARRVFALCAANFENIIIIYIYLNFNKRGFGVLGFWGFGV